MTILKISCTNKGISDCLNFQIPSEHAAGTNGKWCVSPSHFPGPGNTHRMLHVLLSPNSFPERVTGERHRRAGGSLHSTRLRSLWFPPFWGPQLGLGCGWAGMDGKGLQDADGGLGAQQVTLLGNETPAFILHHLKQVICYT